MFARGVSDADDQTLYGDAFEEPVTEDVQILVTSDLATAAALAVIPRSSRPPRTARRT